jgi:dolichol-phosphate mannosyltransferase
LGEIVTSNFEITIVLPAYREEETIALTVTKLYENLQATKKKFEIVIVVDGVVDRTSAVVASLDFSDIVVEVFEKNKGKGAALERGISLARGSSYIGYIDADLDIDSTAIVNAISALENLSEIDIIVGSKLHPQSIVSYPSFRRLQSHAFRILVRFLFKLKVRDTQTGMKVGKSHVMRECLPPEEITGFAFDLSLLVNASRKGYIIQEIPIKLDYQFESTVRIKSALRTVFDTFALYLRN